MFLVLSAFLLTRLLKAEWDATGATDIKHFYLRRLLRIWPLHWGFVTAMLVLQLAQHPEILREAVGFWLSHILFVNNIVMSVIGFERRLAFSSHLWTISLEEQFYIIVPLVMLLVGRRSVTPRKLAAVFGLVIMVLMGMRAACALLQMPHPFIWVLPLRGDSMVLGMALGLGILDGCLKEHRGVLCFIAGVVVLALASQMPSLWDVGWQQVVGYTIIDTGCVLLVAGVLEQNFISRFLANPIFRYLGKISFGLYVYHILAIAAGTKLSERMFHGNPWVTVLISFALTVMMAATSYHLFERRFLLLKERFSTVKSRPA